MRKEMKNLCINREFKKCPHYQRLKEIDKMRDELQESINRKYCESKLVKT